MLSGIWYKFLTTLNHQMAAQNRRIVLVTGDCFSHPRPNNLPKDYNGPPPPVLTYIVLVYLPKNTTYFQPLDQCIIWSFKASDRPKFARKAAHHPNKHPKAPPQPDAPEATHLAPEAPEELLQRVISHCWVKAGILPCLDRNYPDHTDKAFEEFMQHL